MMHLKHNTWKHNVPTVSLVVNPAPLEKGSGGYRRQKYCMDVLKEATPGWGHVHFLDLTCDVEGGALERNSHSEIGDNPPLPSVIEMMHYAIEQGDEWSGVAVADLVFTPAFWIEMEKESSANILIARASQIPDVEDEGIRALHTPVKKPNELSLDALFVRGPAVQQFLDDFPDVYLAEYWDDATVAWIRRHRKLGVRVMNNHETMHKLHEPGWAKGVKFGPGGMVSNLRPVGMWNRGKIVEFKEKRKTKNV
jgi:hypothetical protein